MFHFLQHALCGVQVENAVALLKWALIRRRASSSSGWHRLAEDREWWRLTRRRNRRGRKWEDMVEGGGSILMCFGLMNCEFHGYLLTVLAGLKFNLSTKIYIKY